MHLFMILHINRPRRQFRAASAATISATLVTRASVLVNVDVGMRRVGSELETRRRDDGPATSE